MLSIIIVNYKSSALILQCLESVFHHNLTISFEVIVVDNDSEDDSRQLIMKQFPGVKWIDMGYNAGFARGNNAGIKAAKENMILLLNPDTLAINDSIFQCYRRLKQSEYIGAGVQLLNEDGTKQISGSFFVKGGLNHLLPIPYWGSLIRWLGYKTKSKVPHLEEAKQIEDVDWINGAFIMFKKEVVEKAGMLDEDFFLYAEEIEWCARLKKVGRLCIYGDLKMIHLQGETINKDQQSMDKGYYNLYDKKGLQLMVSNHLRVRKQYGAGWFLFLLFNYSFGIFVFAIVSLFYQLFQLRSPFTEWGRVKAYAKNVVRLWTLAPSMLSNRKRFYKMF